MKLIRKLLFHRVAFVFIAILIQILVITEVILRFNDYFVYFYGFSLLLSIIEVLWIINRQVNPVFKTVWIIPILLFPIFGGLFYLFFNGNRLRNRQKCKMKSVDDKMRVALVHQQSIEDSIGIINEYAFSQSKYISDYAGCPPYGNTVTKYLPDGEITFEHLKEELKKAEHYIFLEYFIIEEGEMWGSILEILKEKASMGVDVRVIYDDIGSLLTLPYRYDKKLEAMGIKCCVFNPLIPLLSIKLNNRDHRKIAVIDGHTGFTGGINLADEYIHKIKKYGHWKDSAIMLKGDAVWSLAVIFLSMWDYIRGVEENFKKFKPDATHGNPIDIDGYVQPFTDNPLDGEAVGETVYLNLIYKAKRYVYITTPYLIIGNEMVTALTSAAKCGVDVRIITPYYSDKWFVHEVTRSCFNFLIESGVRIYEYLPGFIHSKTYVVDDEYGVVGTINMDFRSLYMHFECGVWMYNSGSIKDIKEDFQNTLLMCKQIKREDLEKIRWYRKLLRVVLRVFSPLM